MAQGAIKKSKSTPSSSRRSVHSHTGPIPNPKLTKNNPQTLRPQRQKRSKDHRAEEESVGEAEEDNESVLSSAIYDKGVGC